MGPGCLVILIFFFGLLFFKISMTTFAFQIKCTLTYLTECGETPNVILRVEGRRNVVPCVRCDIKLLFCISFAFPFVLSPALFSPSLSLPNP